LGRAWKHARGLFFVLLLSAAAYGTLILATRYWPAANTYAKSTAVFFVTKVTGDALQFAFYTPDEPVFGEDFVREIFVFSAIGLVAGAAISLATQVVGGPVTPVWPAVGGYLVYGFTSRRG